MPTRAGTTETNLIGLAEESKPAGNGDQKPQAAAPEVIQVKLHEKKTEKVVVLGYAPSSRDLAPFKDESFEIWGVNELYLMVPRVDVLFDIHGYELMKSKARNPGHLKWLQESKIPIYMQKHFDDIPRSIEYPIDLMVKLWGDYYTNSISYMIALATFMEYKEIHIYGVDMATDLEYQVQRPSVEYFVGVAVGAGRTVYIPPQADVLKTTYLYGYDDGKRSEIKLKMDAREKELQGRVATLQQQIENLSIQMHQLIGAGDDVRFWKRGWVFNPEPWTAEKKKE
ncbi:MAG: hypothetical protein ABIF82_00600 [Planctomycetota bacterium]